MRESMTLERYLRRSHLAEELVESWPTEEGVNEPEAIVDELLQLRDLARNALQLLLSELYDETKAKASFRTEEKVRTSFAHSLRAFHRAGSMLERFGTGPLPLETRSAFTRAFAEMREFQKQLDEAIPPFNPEMTMQAVAEAQRGEGEFVEDLLARLQDQNPAGGQ
jgi:hypothetical protein